MEIENKYAGIALAAFDTFDFINGTKTGGIEAPRVLEEIRIDIEGNGIVNATVSYTYQATCGLSDVRYHDTRAGEFFEDHYIISKDSITLNGDEDIFDLKGWERDRDIMDRARKFYDKFGFKYPVLMAA